jgi:hypothetical protein
MKDCEDYLKKGYGINKQMENRHHTKLSAVTETSIPVSFLIFQAETGHI